MAKKKEVGLSKGLKALFIFHGVIALVFGFFYIFGPEHRPFGADAGLELLDVLFQESDAVHDS